MPIAWYIAPYKNRTGGMISPARFCAMDDFTTEIYGNGGQWSETEILGDRAIVKVRTETGTLIKLDTEFKRMPVDEMKTSLISVSIAEKDKLKNELLDQGYSQAEIDANLSVDFGNHTLEDIFNVMTLRRLKPRYDEILDKIILDGKIQTCRPIKDVDKEVQ